MEIRSVTEGDVDGLHAALVVVARERRYLARVEAPGLDEVRERVRGNTEKGDLRLVAIEDGKVVGWCDITRRIHVGFEHVGGLGMGVLPEYRGRGVGGLLLATALAAVEAAGFEKVELGVFASNTAAIALYERHGFAHEGRRVRSRKIDGGYDDLLLMGLIFGAGGP